MADDMNNQTAMIARFFDLMRKRRFEDLVYVPTADESKTLYTHTERDRDGELRAYPAMCVRRCPVEADNIELREIQHALDAAGVTLFL